MSEAIVSPPTGHPPPDLILSLYQNPRGPAIRRVAMAGLILPSVVIRTLATTTFSRLQPRSYPARTATGCDDNDWLRTHSPDLSAIRALPSPAAM